MFVYLVYNMWLIGVRACDSSRSVGSNHGRRVVHASSPSTISLGLVVVLFVWFMVPNGDFFSWFIYHHSMDQEQMDSHLTDGNSVDESHDATRTEADGGKLRASASGGDVDQIPRETVVSGNFTSFPSS